MILKNKFISIITAIIIANVAVGFYLVLATDRVPLNYIEYDPLSMSNNSEHLSENSNNC